MNSTNKTTNQVNPLTPVNQSIKTANNGVGGNRVNDNTKVNSLKLLSSFPGFINSSLNSNNYNLRRIHRFYKGGTVLRNLKFKNSPLLTDYALYGFLILTKLLIKKYIDSPDGKFLQEFKSNISGIGGIYSNNKQQNNINMGDFESRVINIKCDNPKLKMNFPTLKTAKTYRGKSGYDNNKLFSIVRIIKYRGNTIGKRARELSGKPITNKYIGINSLYPNVDKSLFSFNFVTEKNSNEKVMNEINGFIQSLKTRVFKIKISNKKQKQKQINNVVLYENLNIQAQDLITIGIICSHTEKIHFCLNTQSYGKKNKIVNMKPTITNNIQT